jgi:hypothetical protein
MLELREVIPQIIDRFELLPANDRPERPKLYGTALAPRRRRKGRASDTSIEGAARGAICGANPFGAADGPTPE